MEPSLSVIELPRGTKPALAVHLFLEIERHDLVAIEVDDRTAARARHRIRNMQLKLVVIALSDLLEKDLGEAVLEDDVQINPQPVADRVLLTMTELRERKSSYAL